MSASTFWGNQPTVLFQKEYITEVVPSSEMSYERKINAIARLILIITLIGAIVTASWHLFLIGLATLAAMYVLYWLKYRGERAGITAWSAEEGFQPRLGVSDGIEPVDSPESGLEFVRPALRQGGGGGVGGSTPKVSLKEVVNAEFQHTTKRNPFGNVLLTDIMDNPERKSAAPAFNLTVDKEITNNVKRAVQNMNPGIDNTNKQLFGDLYERYRLDKSNQRFYSMPATRVANDQGAFAKWLFSTTKYSAKESTPEGAAARVQDNLRYINY